MENQENLSEEDKTILRQHYAEKMKAASTLYMEALYKYKRYGGVDDGPLIPSNTATQLNFALKSKEPFKWKKTTLDTVKNAHSPLKAVDIYNINEADIIKATEPRDKALRSISSSLYYLVQEGELQKLKIEGENEYYYADKVWFENDKIIDEYNPKSLKIIEVL